jgi:hypothetical protein
MPLGPLSRLCLRPPSLSLPPPRPPPGTCAGTTSTAPSARRHTRTLLRTTRTATWSETGRSVLPQQWLLVQCAPLDTPLATSAGPKHHRVGRERRRQDGDDEARAGVPDRCAPSRGRWPQPQPQLTRATLCPPEMSNSVHPSKNDGETPLEDQCLFAQTARSGRREYVMWSALTPTLLIPNRSWSRLATPALCATTTRPGMASGLRSSLVGRARSRGPSSRRTSWRRPGWSAWTRGSGPTTSSTRCDPVGLGCPPLSNVQCSSSADALALHTPHSCWLAPS